MDGTRWLHGCPQRGTDLYRQQSSVLIAMLDRFRQGDRLWHHPRGPSPFAGGRQLAIGSYQDVLVTVPAIAEPVQFALVGALDRGGHCLLDQFLAQGTGGAGDHKATCPILHQAAPAFPLVRLAGCAVFFGRWTKILRSPRGVDTDGGQAPWY